jgi:hypothetical protein
LDAVNLVAYPDPHAGIVKGLHPSINLAVVELLQDAFQRRRGQQSGHGVSLSSFPSCESFVFRAKIREAFLLGKVSGEWLSLVLAKDALHRRRRLLEVPVAEMVNRRAQEQAFPIAKVNASIFERSEGFLQTAAGVRSPKVAIEIRILPRWLFAHRSRMGTSCGRLEMLSL